jgi:hypothetical protein
MSDLLNAKEVCDRLGIKHSTWAERKKRGFHKLFEVARPMGQKRYSRERVDQYVSAAPMSTFGRRTA